MQNFTSESKIPAALLVAAVSTPNTRGSDELPEVVYLAAEFILLLASIKSEYNGERVITQASTEVVEAALSKFSVWHVETCYNQNNHFVTRAIRGYDGQ